VRARREATNLKYNNSYEIKFEHIKSYIKTLKKRRTKEYYQVCYKGVWINEHRFIVQYLLGRKLDKKEVVHHIDQDKSNNHYKNLCVMKEKYHTQYHTFLKKGCHLDLKGYTIHMF